MADPRPCIGGTINGLCRRPAILRDPERYGDLGVRLSRSGEPIPLCDRCDRRIQSGEMIVIHQGGM